MVGLPSKLKFCSMIVATRQRLQNVDSTIYLKLMTLLYLVFLQLRF